MSSVAAVIVTYHTGPRLKDCLQALKANTYIDEMIVVDNGNPSRMTAWLELFDTGTDKMRYLVQERNVGFGGAVNIGAATTQADTLLVINPDCVIRHDAVSALLQAMENQPSPTLVGGRIFGIDGVNQRGPMRRELTLTRMLSKIFGGRGINLPLTPQPVAPISVETTSGAFFLIDRAGFETLDGFDEGYFLHVEDIDLCKRVRLAGGRVIYQPQAGAMHEGATSDMPNRTVERHKAAGFARYLRKFSKGPVHRMMAETIIPLIYLGLSLRARIGAR